MWHDFFCFEFFGAVECGKRLQGRVYANMIQMEERTENLVGML
jgi:hypothetical protein